MTCLPVVPNSAEHILVASPSSVVRHRLLEGLRSPARRVAQASGGAEALDHLENGLCQVLFLDRSLPDLDAEELSRIIRQRFPKIEIVLVDSMNDSAPESVGEFTAAVDRAETNHLRLASAWNRQTSSPIGPVEEECTADDATKNSILQEPLPGMIGTSSGMRAVYRAARLLARRNTTVLITGPTGSGKELVARAIHELSTRASRAFVVINCAAIPEALLESELFGHTRGAFTGAMQSYGGRIQSAQGGTLFLDEIGDMPLSLQPKLLRFLEQKELQRLGSCDTVRVDVRVVAATNAYLPALVRQGKFREDLYYRVSTFPLEIPTLRERVEDIAQLACHFLEKFAQRPSAPELSSESMQWLKAQAWSGNVRELQNVIERALILAEGETVIRPEHLLMPNSSRS
jgi:DNA-binding NtrC family response regulator